MTVTMLPLPCRLRASLGLLIALCMTGLLSPLDLLAQRPGERGRGVPDVREIDARSGAELLDDFRAQRLQGDFVFRFDLVYLPRRDDAKTYDGMMWGTWTDAGPCTRVAIWNPEQPADVLLQLLIQGGPNPVVWRSERGGQPIRLEASEWEQPLLPPMPYSPFDLLMPFIYWQDAHYLGSERLRGRPAHRFRIHADQAAVAEEMVAAVDLSLDARFNALLGADMLDQDGNPIRSLRVQSFRMVNDQYIVKSIDLTDEQSRDRARFQVWRAGVGLALPPHVFDPATLADIPFVEGLRLESM